MRIKFAFLLLVSQLIFCASTNSQCTNCGSYTFKNKYYDSVVQGFMPMKHVRDLRILFKDSMAIVPTTMVNTIYVNDIETDVISKDKYYTFIDLHVKPIENTHFLGDTLFSNRFKGVTFYQYPALSKDSFFVNKYYNVDTAQKRVEWLFFIDVNSTDTTDYSKKERDWLADTLIENIPVMRYKDEFITDNRHKYMSVVYLRKNYEPWMLFFGNNAKSVSLIRGFNCLLYRSDWTLVGLQPWISQEHQYISGLTKEELEIFAAWEKNAKENPVTGKEKY